MPHRTIVDVHVLLVRDGEVLLSQRRGGYAAGQWHMPSGKLEPGESIEHAAIREAREEVGVDLDPAALRCVHASHVLPPGEDPRVGFFFEATAWTGEPANREPEKCSAIGWFDLDHLPDGMVPYPAAGLMAYRDGVPFAVDGWSESDDRPADATRYSVLT
ncbi:NUDIX hydrolase [Cryptosporangium phraense]|uniref:NUDIX domain-containing protein n=1 Tax=Cryptosporangium phraense TaxID=2593070 RepID=A0A545AN90_9ACTN|nr:NUDIX domain-containing protein [Cryptosporangium phraense]TQS42756.1 NUDIX domain-containing protein [Cryptosporangium phraense]